MKRLFAVTGLMGALPLLANPTCPLCEIHRAYNKEHPGEYEYFEDYLKAEGKEKTDSKNPTETKNKEDTHL